MHNIEKRGFIPARLIENEPGRNMANLTVNESRLIQGIVNGNFDIVSAFIDQGINVNCICHLVGSNPLNFACMFGQVEIAKFLIQNGANINKSCYGTTPLEMALSEEHPELAVDLVNLGAECKDIDFEDCGLLDEEKNILLGLKNRNIKPARS